MKIRHKETGQIAFSNKWNLNAIAEIIVCYPDGSRDSDYAKNWVCDCHNLPLGKDPDGYGIVMCLKKMTKLPKPNPHE